jgi:hypothetical protein
MGTGEISVDKHFKPLLAAAVAAGVLPVFTPVKRADGVTAAQFTFDGGGSAAFSGTATSTLPGSVSGSASASQIFYLADSGTGSITGLKANTSGAYGSMGFSPGNGGTGNALSTNNFVSGTYKIAFSIDDLSNIVLTFDQGGSTTGPRDFQLSYSLDGSTFSTLSPYALSSGTATTFNTFVVSLPTAFSDSAPGVAGQTGFFLISDISASNGSFMAINGLSSAGSTGTDRLDNILITGNAVPEPAIGSILTLASASLLFKRQRRATV